MIHSSEQNSTNDGHHPLGMLIIRSNIMSLILQDYYRRARSRSYYQLTTARWLGLSYFLLLPCQVKKQEISWQAFCKGEKFCWKPWLYENKQKFAKDTANKAKKNHAKFLQRMGYSDDTMFDYRLIVYPWVEAKWSQT